MSTRRTWGAAALAAALAGGVAAWASSPGGPTPPPLAFAGKLKREGAPWAGPLAFTFHRDGTQVCAATVDASPDADGSFEAALPMGSCPADLWDGRNVTYDVDVVDQGTNVRVVTGHPVRAVPLAKFADSAGAAVRADAPPPCNAARAGALYFDPTLRQFRGCDGNGYVALSANGPQDAAPPGTVIFFDGPACPTGWSELVEARGRYLVGIQPNGVLRAPIGQALTAGENRPAGAHGHAGGTDAQGDHVHGWGPASGSVFVTGGTNNLVWATIGTPGWGVANMAAAGAHGHNVTVGNPAGSVSGTSAPYLTLLACRKD